MTASQDGHMGPPTSDENDKFIHSARHMVKRQKDVGVKDSRSFKYNQNIFTKI